MPCANRWHEGVHPPGSGSSCRSFGADACCPALTWTTRPRYWTSWTVWLILPDVNVLVYALRDASSYHTECRSWLDDLMHGDEAFGMSELVLSGFVRIVTHPRIFDPPTKLADALDFVAALRSAPGYTVTRPGPRHWDIFANLCRHARARGSLVSDAYLAALAIESGSEWTTTDGDFARFSGLRWRRPF